MYACVYKRGSLVYKLYQADREKLADTLAELVCLGVNDVAITGDTLRITPIMKGE